MRSTSRGLSIAICLGALVVAMPASAQKAVKTSDVHGNAIDALVAKHAAAHNLPEDLVRRVIKRESRGNPRVISKGNYGLMQIRLGTARSMGYRGDATGLLDADTNMTYAVKYLAGAYKAADGNHDRAVRYYASGYYYVAKRRGMDMPTAAAPAVAATLASAQVSTAEAAETEDAVDDSAIQAAQDDHLSSSH